MIILVGQAKAWKHVFEDAMAQSQFSKLPRICSFKKSKSLQIPPAAAQGSPASSVPPAVSSEAKDSKRKIPSETFVISHYTIYTIYYPN